MTSVPLDRGWLAPTAALAATFAATWLLARLAPRLGWVDPGDGGRKPQRKPLPLVGGLAVAVGLVVAWGLAGLQPAVGLGLDEVLSGGWWRRMAPEAWLALLVPPGPVWALPALAAALTVGLVDDQLPAGLSPRAKLAGQVLAGVVLAWPWIAAGELGLGLALVAGAVVAMNAVNTYDNADGAASGLALIALAPALPLASAALAGFLPFNVRRADGRSLLGRLPRAILGDSGSHLLGMLILLTPTAWPALALPLLDLARVCVERMRCGQRPWVGDRRHLAHRLEERGLPPLGVALTLALVALPSATLGRFAADSSVELALLGVAVTAGLFGLATVLSRPASPPPVAERADFGLGA